MQASTWTPATAIYHGRSLSNLACKTLSPLTPQITGGEKQSDEGAALFAVRVDLPC